MVSPQDTHHNGQAATARRAVSVARTQKVSMVIARYIANDVASRGLQPGSPLPPEHEMAQTFGAGRPSVREALRLLEAQGLVAIRPGQGGGPVVGSPGGAEFGQTLSLYLQMSRRSLREVMESAVLVGGMIARVAAERMAEGHHECVEELTAASKEQVKGQSDEDFLQSGIRFHRLISAISGNFTLQLFNDALSYIYAVTAAESHGGHWADQDKEHSSRDHVELAKAIRRGAGERAASIQEAHLRRELEFIDRERPGLLDKTVEWS